MSDPSSTIEPEARAYGPDSSAAENAAIRARVTLRGSRCVLYHELPVMSAYSVDLCYDRVEELIETHGRTILLIDVREAGRPDALMRRQIVERMTRLQGQITQIGVILDGNPLVSVALKFMQALIWIRASHYASIDEALAAMGESPAV